MKEKRGLWQMIFGGSEKEKSSYSRLQLLSGYMPVFSTWAGTPYDADVVRSAVDAIARNAAKLKPKHIRRTNDNISAIHGTIENILQIRPNPNMSTYDFIYKMVTLLMIDNNAFAYPVWEGMQLVALWPINCIQADFLEDDSKTIYVRFYFPMGKQIVLPYVDVIHLRRHYYRSDMAGEVNKPIDATLSAINTTNEGIVQAIKSSANLRGIIKYQGMLKEADIKTNRDRFVAEYMTVNNNGGIAALDAKADYTELKNEPKMVNAAQMKELRENVYRYFGVSEEIVKGSYNEDQWNAFYESTIEPLAVQMSLEFTTKLFTDRERGRGNEIVFEANRLQYASAKTKVMLVQQMVPMGLLTINEAREIFNLAPVDDGDKRLVSLNYVSADKADLYQLGKDNVSTKPGDKGKESDVQDAGIMGSEA